MKPVVLGDELYQTGLYSAALFGNSDLLPISEHKNVSNFTLRNVMPCLTGRIPLGTSQASEMVRSKWQHRTVRISQIYIIIRLITTVNPGDVVLTKFLKIISSMDIISTAIVQSQTKLELAYIEQAKRDYSTKRSTFWYKQMISQMQED